jgi:hypothetical protein
LALVLSCFFFWLVIASELRVNAINAKIIVINSQSDVGFTGGVVGCGVGLSVGVPADVGFDDCLGARALPSSMSPGASNAAAVTLALTVSSSTPPASQASRTQSRYQEQAKSSNHFRFIESNKLSFLTYFQWLTSCLTRFFQIGKYLLSNLVRRS